MDPHEVLGVRPGAGPEDIARAYRDLAKRFHPDVRPDDTGAALLMRDINAAYAALTGGTPRGTTTAAPRDRAAAPRGRHARAGAGLPEPMRRALGTELLAALENGEQVTVVTDAATSDAFHVRLVVSDRRLLWLRDDALTDRVRFLRWSAVERVDGRLKGRRRPTGRLEIEPRRGRRVVFAELDPHALRTVLAAIRKMIPA